MIEKIVAFWNDKTKDVYKINGKNIVLNKFDGERYFDCFELDKNCIEIIAKNIEVLPKFKINKNGDAILNELIIL